jgi:hypothetical protein
MAASRRYRCGECTYEPKGLSATEGAEQLAEHYAGCHPGIAVHDRVEIRRARPREGVGCLMIMAILLLLLILAASCQCRTPT